MTLANLLTGLGCTALGFILGWCYCARMPRPVAPNRRHEIDAARDRRFGARYVAYRAEIKGSRN